MSGVSVNSLFFVELFNKFRNAFLPQPNVRVIYKRKTYNHHNTYMNMYCNKLIEKKCNSYINTHKKNFKKCLEDINNKNNIIYWIYDNNIKILLKYKVVVIDFQCIYDYKNRQELKMNYLKNLSKYLLDNKIIFCIVSEINPTFFPKIEYFNPVNLITPYHYKSKTFGGVVKLGINKYSDKSVQVGVSRIINDIMNQYGCIEEELVYINSNKIDKINTIII